MKAENCSASARTVLNRTQNFYSSLAINRGKCHNLHLGLHNATIHTHTQKRKQLVTQTSHVSVTVFKTKINMASPYKISKKKNAEKNLVKYFFKTPSKAERNYLGILQSSSRSVGVWRGFFFSYTFKQRMYPATSKKL